MLVLGALSVPDANRDIVFARAELLDDGLVAEVDFSSDGAKSAECELEMKDPQGNIVFQGGIEADDYNESGFFVSYSWWIIWYIEA